MLARVLLPLLLFILLWLVFMPAVIQSMIESPTVNTGIFIPFVAIVGSVALHLAMLAEGLGFLICLIVVAHLHILKLCHDAFEE